MIYWTYNDERLTPGKGWGSGGGVVQPRNWDTAWSDEYKLEFGLVRHEEDDPVVAVYEPTWEENRISSYPYMGDQLDDLFHQGAFSDEMAAKLQAVKDKYPKPE